MANDFSNNFTTKLAKVILKAFESYRVLSKNVDTQLLTGKFGPDSGGTTEFKRPTDYTTKRTSNGDISGASRDPIVTAKAMGTVQDYFTVDVEFDEADQAIKMDQQKQLVEMPMIRRIVTDLELDYANFMMKNTALLAGTFGTAADTWDAVANAGAMMTAAGIPGDSPWYYSVNPFTQAKLASNTRALGSGGSSGSLITQAQKKATISENFAGFDRVMTATTLSSFTTHSGVDRAGTIDTAGIDVTYDTNKNTMTQSLLVTGFQANLQIRAGEVLQIAGRSRLNLNTREPILDAAGNTILFTGTVTTAVTLDASGEGTVVITGPAIYEATGAYNTTSTAAAAGDVITLLGAASTIYQPNLFWHKQAFSIGSVPMKKLYSTDTIATTKDGLQMRISYGVGFLENLQKIRIDLRPAYAVLNPFFAGQGWGS